MSEAMPNRRKKHAVTNIKKDTASQKKIEDDLQFAKIQENNNISLSKSEEFDDESSTACEHLKECGSFSMEALKQKKLQCCTCKKAADFSCIHEQCLDDTKSSCCDNVSHLFAHIAKNDHPIIVHHKFQLILCTQCNIQIPVAEYLSRFKINTEIEWTEEMSATELVDLRAVLGYVNFGNTCYMNAVFQLLGHCSPFAEYFTTLVPPNELNNTTAAARSTVIQLALDFRVMWSSIPLPYISPWRIIHCIRSELPAFESFQQQDAAEFLRALLDILDRELKLFGDLRQEDIGIDPTPLEDSGLDVPYHQKRTVVSDTFQGTLENQIQCHSCGYRSRTFETFLDLPVPILSEEEEYLGAYSNIVQEGVAEKVPTEHPLEGDEGTDPGFVVHRKIGNKTSLIECMDRYFGNNMLHGENQYFCSKCKKHVDATKFTRAVSLPEVIFIQLKRFRHTMYGVRKVDKIVEFPIRSMDFGPWTSSGQQDIYDLSGFVVHDGYSVEYGHYVTYCRHEYDKMWYKFDDLNVTRYDVTRVAQQQPYILMFKRRHFEENNTGRVRRLTDIHYNARDTDRRYMEQCPSAWTLIDKAFEANDQNDGQEDQSSSPQAKKIKHSEDVYNTLFTMLEEIKKAIVKNAQRKTDNPQSRDNTAQALDKLVETIEKWFKEILKDSWNERECIRSTPHSMEVEKHPIPGPRETKDKKND